MADKQISQLVAATTINDDDLFVMQQGGTAKKLSGQKLADFVYQSAADQIERVDEAVEQAQAAVDSLEEQKNEIAQAVASMAELGTDTTLTTPGMAADAAATGVVKDIALARFEHAEITGVPIATFDDGADDVPVKKLVVNIEPVQSGSGDPSPDNVRPITGWTGVNVYRSGADTSNPTTYPITFPSEAGTVYGGTLDVTNGVLNVNFASVDLGTLTWKLNTTYNVFYASLPLAKMFGSIHGGLCYCSAYKTIYNDASATWSNFPDKAVSCGNNFSTGAMLNLVIKDTDYDNASDFTTAVNGVQLVYELAEPITYTLTPTEVKTLLALNNIWADTGNITELIYRKMPTSTNEVYNTIESMIAGVEQTMEATQNYTSGKLVVAVHKLYHIDFNIASGETLIPEVNCHVTTISDELVALDNSISLELAALGNVSTLTYQVVT